MTLLTSSTIGVQIFQLFAAFASLAALFYYDITLMSVLLILLGYFLYGCLGIVITFHRLYTHNSFRTKEFISNIFAVLGCFSGTGSPLAWVAIHINHHLKSDKPSDPHSPLYKGLKIFTLNYNNEIDVHTKWKMRTLITDRFQQFLHRYYFAILTTWMITLFLIGGPYLVAFLHIIPATLTALMSNVVNYVGHKPNLLGSYRSYHLNDQSSNNWLWAIPSWGESWHNNHHRFPKRWYFGTKWYHIDISGIIIKVIKI